MFNAQFVIEQREKKGISAEEMAQSLGTTVSVYNAYESGKKTPSAMIVMMIAKELDVPYRDVRGDNVEVSEYSGRKDNFDGEKLWKLRTEMNLSRIKMAEEIGVSRKALDNWEHCLATPTEENLEKLEKYCNVPHGFFDKNE